MNLTTTKVRPAFSSASSSRSRIDRKEVFHQGFACYCQNTSLHGWPYLESESAWWRKLFWALVVLGALALGTWFTVTNILEYQNSGTVTSINSTTASLKDLVFPSFLVCNVNQVTASFLERINLSPRDDKEKKLLFDQFLDGGGNQNQGTLDELKERMKVAYGWNESVPFYRIASQNCSDMILEATWKSKYTKRFTATGKNSTGVFFKSATDYGACCLITPYLDFVSNLTEESTPTEIYWHSIPKGITRNGIQNGLKVILDVENYDYAYFPRGAKGFRATVGDSRDKGLINQNGFYISSGSETLAAMTMAVLNATEAALAFDPAVRGCYKSRDFYFKYMNYAQGFRYSMANCLYEAVLEAILDECKCLPNFANFRIENDTNIVVCLGENLTCARTWLENIGNDDFNGRDLTQASTNETDGDGHYVMKKCRQRCENQDNRLTMTSSSYPNRQTFPYREDFCLVMKKIVKVCNDPVRQQAFAARYGDNICPQIVNAYNGADFCKLNYPDVEDIETFEEIVNFVNEYAADNIAIVKLFIRDPYYTNTIRDRAITFTSFVGNAGGLLGLCMGFSFVSIFEIVYFLCNCFGKSMRK